jgi:hypothetical protein
MVATRPHPRALLWCAGRPEDAAETRPFLQHVVVVVAPLPGRTRGRAALEDQWESSCCAQTINRSIPIPIDPTRLCGGIVCRRDDLHGVSGNASNSDVLKPAGGLDKCEPCRRCSLTELFLGKKHSDEAMNNQIEAVTNKEPKLARGGMSETCQRSPWR